MTDMVMNFFRRIFQGGASVVYLGPVRIQKAILLSLLVVLMAPMLSSCKKNDGGAGPVGREQYLDISIIIPGQDEHRINTTRHGNDRPGEDDENKITTLTFIVFRESDNSFEQYKSLSINAGNISDDPMWDADKSSYRLILTAGVKNIYLVANWPINGTAEMPTLSGVQSVQALTSHVRNHSGVTPSCPPVMTGCIQENLQGGEQGIEIELTRQIARVDVYPQISKNAKTLGANVSIEGIKFTNMAGESYLYPQENPTAPAAVWSQTSFAGTTSGAITSVTGDSTSPAPTRYGRYYIPEHYGTTQAHTVMVIHAKYNGTDTYYFIDVNGQSGANPALYAVERNHSYRYTVTIQGRGSDTPAGIAAFEPVIDGEPVEPGIANISYELDIE